jgi:hypothetical protein
MSPMSITFWSRLEARPRDRSIRRSLAAEIRDPLWLLARQWQLGEFQGEDAGSPQGVVVETETVGVTGWQALGGGDALRATSPLEPQVLAEPYVPDLAMRAEIAATFLRLLDDEGLAAPIIERYPIAPLDVSDPLRPTEPAARRFAAFMAGRLFDGFQLYQEIGSAAPIPGRGTPAVDGAHDAVRAWVETTYGRLALADTEADPRTWHRERLEHRAELTADNGEAGTIRLVARPDAGGALDWDSFELAATDDHSVPRPTQSFEVQPTHVRFPGMPNARFWDFEEGTMSFADVEPATRDLAKMMLVEFALVQGADWFYFDLPQAAATLCRIRSLVVKDVFGRQTLVSRAATDAATTASPRWALYQLSRAAGAVPGTPELADFLFVPPTSAAVQQVARPLEEVLFARDEMANMAWAVERATPSLLGEPWPGHERDAALPPPMVPPPTADAPPLTYQLMSRVPVHWTPLLPARRQVGAANGRPQVVLLTSNVVRTPPIPAPIRGKILRPGDLSHDEHDPRAYLLHEEEVPRAGVLVRRMMVRSRWIDGTSHLWFARARSTGRGETGSGLRFDAAIDSKR